MKARSLRHYKCERKRGVFVWVEMALRKQWSGVMALDARFNSSARQSVSGGRAARETFSTGGRRPLILCVDDEPDARTILRLFLSAHGFEIIVAADAVEGLRLIGERRPDLIITDYAMPGVSGLELCRTLRDRDETHDIPIILYTGIELDTDHSELFDRFVLKPAELDHLAREVRELLPAARAQRYG